MAVTVALINMKGGVGKTTLTVQLAWHFYYEGKKVLVVDLDPQSNASHYLMGANRYKLFVEEQKPSIIHVFERFSTFHAPIYETEDVIQVIKQSYDDCYLHLIPSVLELSLTLKNPTSKEHLLVQCLQKVKETYDLILIDCPPTESIFTTAAYLASDYVLIPVKPEFLSTIGLPLMAKSLQNYREIYKDNDLEVAGIVMNDVDTNNDETKRALHDIVKESAIHGWHVFSEKIKRSNSFLKSARDHTALVDTLYTRTKVRDEFAVFARALQRRIGL